MLDILQRVNELERRLANALIVGAIADVDYDNALVKARAGDLVTGWLPWITTRAGSDTSWWAPELGEQVLVMSPNGSLEQGVVLPAIYQDKHQASDTSASLRTIQMSDGAVFRYDRETHVLTISLPAGATTELLSDGGVNVTGDTTITGALRVTDDIKGDAEITDHTRSMQGDRDIYNDHDHPHGDPAVGTVNQQQ